MGTSRFIRVILYSVFLFLVWYVIMYSYVKYQVLKEKIRGNDENGTI